MPAHQSNQSDKPPSKPARITPLALLGFRSLTLTNQHYSVQRPAKHLGCLPSTPTSLENAPLPHHPPTRRPTHPHVIIQQQDHPRYLQTLPSERGPNWELSPWSSSRRTVPHCFKDLVSLGPLSTSIWTPMSSRSTPQFIASLYRNWSQSKQH